MNNTEQLGKHDRFVALPSHQSLVQSTVVVQRFAAGARCPSRQSSHYWIGVHSGLSWRLVWGARRDFRVPEGGWCARQRYQRELRRYDDRVRDSEIMLRG